MIVYGIVKDYTYATDGILKIKVRIPNIHGPMDRRSYQGQLVRNYVEDRDLPEYDSLLLHHLPVEGEVVALMSKSEAANDFVVIGLTGGSYYHGTEADSNPK